MKKYYEIDRSKYIPKLIQLLLLKNVKVIEIEKKMLLTILQALQKTNADFTDLYLLYTQSAKNILSFDKDFKKKPQ